MKVPPGLIHQKVGHSCRHLNLHTMPPTVKQAALHAKNMEQSSSGHAHSHAKMETSVLGKHSERPSVATLLAN